jgi:hypothetical protein
MNLTARPIYAKPEPVAKDPAHLARVRELPCCICEAHGEAQASPTAAHHCIMGRYGNRKTPDRMAIPLCEGHHQGLRDTSKIAIHREPELWRASYGADHEWIAVTLDKLGL